MSVLIAASTSMLHFTFPLDSFDQREYVVIGGVIFATGTNTSSPDFHQGIARK